MPSDIVTITPSGKRVVFNEKYHSYTLEGKKCTSVTTWVGKFFKPFAANSIAENLARKRGVDKQEILDEWQYAREYGTRTHMVCEDVLNGNELRSFPQTKKEKAIFSCAMATAEKVKMRICEYHPEYVLCDESHLLCGTSDLVGKLSHKQNDGSEYLILDWKTNKSIDKEGFRGETGMGPCSAIPDASWWHYALQLSAYEYIMKNNGYVDKDAKFKRVLAHFVYDPTESEGNVVFHSMPDMSDTIVKMLDSKLV